MIKKCSNKNIYALLLPIPTELLYHANDNQKNVSHVETEQLIPIESFKKIISLYRKEIKENKLSQKVNEINKKDITEKEKKGKIKEFKLKLPEVVDEEILRIFKKIYFSKRKYLIYLNDKEKIKFSNKINIFDKNDFRFFEPLFKQVENILS